jgi:hypothetical protein
LKGTRADARIELRFETTALARAVAAATEVDDPPAFARTTVKDRTVSFAARGPSLASVRESADDFLRCAIAAAGAAKAAGPACAPRARL